jgi:Spy/CpxP family protein refolding chaperone
MKRIITLSMAALLLTGSAMAQDTQKPAKEKAGKEWKKEGHGKHKGFGKELNLTDAQKDQMKSIREEYKGKLKSLKEQGVARDDARFKSLREEERNKVQGILTAEQKAKMAEMKTKREGERKERGEKMKERGAKHFEKMQKELNLSNEQAAKVKASNESFRTQMQAIHKTKVFQKIKRKSK